MRKSVLFVIMVVAACIGMHAQTISRTAPKGKGIPMRSCQRLIGKDNLSQEMVAAKSMTPVIKQKAVSQSDIKKTLFTQTRKNGKTLSIHELKNGRIVKQLVNTNKPQVDRISTKTNNLLKAEASATDNTFFEGFEGWDGTTWNWLPQGWEDMSKVNSSAGSPETGINFTWHVTEGYFTYPPEGDYMATVMSDIDYDDDDGIILFPQDEWLISPSITPKQYENLYFDLGYNPALMLIDIDTYEYTAENEQIEVYISTDNGTNWNKEWDVKADVLSYSEAQLDNYLGGASLWKTFKINLAKYVGKPVKIAFRVVNSGWGESVYLDAVTVTTPNPQALYVRPDGYFYNGFTDDYRFYGGETNVMLGPAYTPASWYNYSNFDSEEFDWTFTNPLFENENDYVHFTDANATITYPYAEFYAPTLQAYAANKTFSASYEWNDGAGFVQTGGESETGYAGNYDVRNGFTAYAYGNDGYVFGTNNDALYAPHKLDAVANYFNKPAHKYCFSELLIRGRNFKASSDAILTVVIRRVDESGILRDTIATSSVSPSQVLLKQKSGNVEYYIIPFTFTQIDPETGREEPTYLEIEDAIFVELKGFNDGKVQSFGLFQQYEPHPGYEANGYMFLVATNDDGTTNRSLFSIANYFTVSMYTSFLFDMDVTYPFLVTDDNKYAAPDNGGTKDFAIKSYWTTDSWQLKEELPDWISIGELTGDPQTGIVTVPVTVDPLPQGVKGRNADITIQALACDVTLKFKQGDGWFTNINQVNPKNIKVINQGDRFALSYPAGTTSVAVYNVAGQKMAEYALSSAGTSSIPAANWSKGVYILKFAGKTNETVKVIK